MLDTCQAPVCTIFWLCWGFVYICSCGLWCPWSTTSMCLSSWESWSCKQLHFSGKPAFLKITGRLSTFHNEALSMFHTSAAIQFCLHPGGSYKHASCFKYMTCSCYAWQLTACAFYSVPIVDCAGKPSSFWGQSLQLSKGYHWRQHELVNGASGCKKVHFPDFLLCTRACFSQGKNCPIPAMLSAYCSLYNWLTDCLWAGHCTRRFP